MSKRTGLGRGIGALIPSAPAQPATDDATSAPRDRPVDVFFPAAKTADGTELAAVPGARLAELSLDAIVPNHVQPRDVFDEDDLSELEHSIREFGVLQPIVVRPLAGSTDRFELIMGERRWRASRRAGRTTVPALIKDTPDDEMLRDALLENLHRADLNPLEEASAYQQLLSDFSITQDELSRRIGRSRPQISNTIRLLRLPESIQTRVASGVLSAGHARAILSVDDEDGMTRLADRIVNEELSVRAAEHAASLAQVRVPRRTPQRGGVQRGLDEVAERLTDRLDTRVRVSLGRTKGQIVVDFATVADLNRILAALGEQPFGDAVSLAD
ncbi:ParB/RepB/Spo0J family partition protein [Agrococcus versicolor]|uniref:ParB/RepB/Spo0J family partition protein n=1 Tax=Agrococcus versicolor TaxID=501482 RepID=A0ABN3AZD2_9MICO